VGAIGTSLEKAHAAGQVPGAAPRRSRPLKPAEVDALVAGYEAGETTKELAAEYGIHRVTVSSHLRRAGIPLRRSGLNAAQIAEAADLYRAGYSSERIAERFGVNADTVIRALRRAGVAIRRRRGGPRSKRPTA